MEFFIAFFQSLLQSPIYFYIVSSVCLLFFGEPIILAVAFMSASYNLFPVWLFGIIAFITAVIAELFWYYIGRTSLAKKIFLHPRTDEMIALMERTHVHKPLPLLFITRLFTGLTIVAIVHLSTRDLKFSTFLLCSIIVNAFWTPFVVAIGYLSGKGYMFALSLFENVHLALTLTFAVLIIFYVIYRTAVRTVTNRS